VQLRHSSAIDTTIATNTRTGKKTAQFPRPERLSVGLVVVLGA
jgi:hypothetical protein